MIIPTYQSGEVVKDGKVVSRQYQKINTDTLDYCWLHHPVLTSDWRNPNAEDKKKLDKIRLKEYVVNDNGTLKKARFCPKCLQTVWYTKEP